MGDLLPRARQQTQPGHDLVGAAGERLEHPLGILGAARLPKRRPVRDDRGVHAEDRPVACLRVDGTGLAERMRPDQRDRVVLDVVLLVPRRREVERDAQLPQDRASLGRHRGQQQRRRGWNAHRCLRATQMSSEGHCRAQSGSGSASKRLGFAP
jgi:hypothetical protein